MVGAGIGARGLEREFFGAQPREGFEQLMITQRGCAMALPSTKTVNPATAPAPPLTIPGFLFLGRNIGIKDDSLDFGVVHATRPCAAAAVFTRNNFPGAPVIVGREHLVDGRLQSVAVNSKNANVATGEGGIEDARRVCRALGSALGIDPSLILPSSTGVIGVPLPVGQLEAACAEVAPLLESTPEAIERFARAIMTTDTRPKWISLPVGPATLTGIAKGSGMIEPNMATMLAFFFTDAELTPEQLRAMLTHAVARSFNRISVDSDTSTSDTVLVMANGLAGAVHPETFASALEEACGYLAREIVRDGEGATKLIELTVCEAASPQAALGIARAVINSPLVKTAIHGADPNWGRFVMAVGKAFDYPVPLENLSIEFGPPRSQQGPPQDAPLSISAHRQEASVLARIGEYLKNEEVTVRIRLGMGRHSETVWGCDLSAEYVRINAEYTT